MMKKKEKKISNRRLIDTQVQCKRCFLQFIFMSLTCLIVIVKFFERTLKLNFLNNNRDYLRLFKNFILVTNNNNNNKKKIF